MLYPVNSIYATIQGEGMYTGIPVVLIRLQGCDVRCSWCDTKETWQVAENNRNDLIQVAFGNPRLYAMMCQTAIAEHARAQFSTISSALITGGEPSLYDLGLLVQALQAHFSLVALETSGTGAIHHIPRELDWICLSPKLHKLPHLEIVEMADEIKFVVTSKEELKRFIDWYHELEPSLRVQVSLQPVSKDPEMTKLCIKYCLAFDWQLSIQVHKYIGVP